MSYEQEKKQSPSNPYQREREKQKYLRNESIYTFNVTTQVQKYHH